MSFDFNRTPAERRVDELSQEVRELRALVNPTKTQRKRLRAIERDRLPSAWRAVHQMRTGLR